MKKKQNVGTVLRSIHLDSAHFNQSINYQVTVESRDTAINRRRAGGYFDKSHQKTC